MNKKVFISYPNTSKDIAELLVNYLEKSGIQAVWIDTDEISVGENISRRLKEGVRESACCVFLLNTYSLESSWCMAEVGSFWGADKKIIMYPIEPRCPIPDYLVGTRFANNLDEVVKACKEVGEPTYSYGEPFHQMFRRSGMTAAFRIPEENPARDNRIKQLISEECELSGQKAFRLMASSGFNYLSSNGQSWKVGLGDAILDIKASFSVVLESPFSLFAKTRALANQVTHHHWQEKISLSELEKLNQLDNVSIRVTEHAVNCSLFFTRRAVFYDPYLWARPKPARKTENNFWVFEFTKVDEQDYDCYELLMKHFDFIESTSIPLQEFLGENHKKYNENTVRFRQEMEAKLKKFLNEKE